MPSAFVPSIVMIQLTVINISVFKIFDIAIILLNMTHG